MCVRAYNLFSLMQQAFLKMVTESQKLQILRHGRIKTCRPFLTCVHKFKVRNQGIDNLPLKFLAPAPINSIALVFIVPNFTSLQDSNNPSPKVSVIKKSIPLTVEFFLT